LAGNPREEPGSARYALAASVEADRPAILAAYARNLVAARSPIVSDPEARQQAMVQADQIITDVAESLRVGRVHVDEGYKLVTWEIGMARAARGTHPRESLKAASMFFEATVASLARHLTADEESLRLFVIAIRALNQSISVRIREAATTYSGYLLDKIHEAHLEERRRIARELHDRIGSGVSLAYRQLELFELYRTTEPVKASTRVETAQQAIQETMLNLRAVTSELRLQEPLKSLEKALLSYLDSARLEDVAIRLRVNGDESWAPPAVSDESFLILREAVRNALSHGHPTMVLVRVDIAPHELRASVVDDGSGFDPHNATGGVGLSSMQERAALIGGMVTVSSQADRGTHVELLVPLPGHRDEPT
jgi:signal transduction histidine kinase